MSELSKRREKLAKQIRRGEQELIKSGLREKLLSSDCLVNTTNTFDSSTKKECNAMAKFEQ